MNNMIKPADLFFTTGQSVFSAGVKFFTHSKWSHVQVVVGRDEGEIVVVSADAEGVFCRNAREGELKRYAILTYPEITEEQRKHVCEFLFSKIGKGYDFAGIIDFLINSDIQAEERFFCSELVFLAYQSVGIHLQERMDHAFVSPEILYISPILRVIEERQ